MKYEIQYKAPKSIKARGSQVIQSFTWKGKALTDCFETAKNEMGMGGRILNRDTGEIYN